LNLYVKPMLSPIVEKQSLGAAFTLVVARAAADGVDMTPVRLRLGVDLRITVDLAGGSLEDLGLGPFRKAQHIDRTMDAGLGRLDWVELIVNG